MHNILNKLYGEWKYILYQGHYKYVRLRFKECINNNDIMIKCKYKSNEKFKLLL